MTSHSQPVGASEPPPSCPGCGNEIDYSKHSHTGYETYSWNCMGADCGIESSKMFSSPKLAMDDAKRRAVPPMPQGIAEAIAHVKEYVLWEEGSLITRNFQAVEAVVEALESTTQRLALMESQSIELQNLVFVPGVFKCSKCEFGLVANIIHSRGISANNDVQLCMNGCGILDQVTERDERIALFKLNDEQLDRIKELESQLPRVFTAETIGDAPEGQYMILCNEGWTGAWEQKILGLKPISMVRDYLSDMDDCRAYGPIEGQVR